MVKKDNLVIQNARKHFINILIQDSHRSYALTFVKENTYIPCSGSDLIIMLKSIHRCWELRDPSIHFLF